MSDGSPEADVLIEDLESAEDVEIERLRARVAALEAEKDHLGHMLKRFVNADSFRLGVKVPYPEAPFGKTTARVEEALALLKETASDS